MLCELSGGRYARSPVKTIAHPDTRYFGAFGYAVKKDASVAAPERGKFKYSYIEFGRQLLEPSPVK